MEPIDLPILSALGQSTRYRAFELLIRHGSEGMLQGEIAKGLGIDKNLMSTHLKIMREAGLVTADRIGREVTYRVTPATARQAAKSILDLIDGTPVPA
jgi:ArsR family transcriptional regulator, arsenate/arsenite/antimonite-responsive transcriptional repressor